MQIFVTIVVASCAILGAFLMLSVALAFFAERDAVSRINALGPATALGLPLIVVAAFVEWTWQAGFSWGLLLKSIATIVALVLVSSVASNTLARAAYRSGAPLDERTSPNDLAEPPAS